MALLRADPVLAGVPIMTAQLEESPLTEMIDVTPEPAPLPVPRGKPRRVGPKQRVLGQIAALFRFAERFDAQQWASFTQRRDKVLDVLIAARLFVVGQFSARFERVILGDSLFGHGSQGDESES